MEDDSEYGRQTETFTSGKSISFDERLEQESPNRISVAFGSSFSNRPIRQRRPKKRPSTRSQQVIQQRHNRYINGDEEPTISEIFAEMLRILSRYMQHHAPSFRRRMFKYAKYFFYSIAFLLAFVLFWSLVVIRSFYIDGVNLCTPPRDFDLFRQPLVEYYVHGRGNGHYVRSMAVIEALNKEGVDVRMFIGRATVWNFFRDYVAPKKTTGTTTAISIKTLLPTIGPFASLSLALERIMGDCEVSSETSRYPMLVITDGDLPGMLRAELGGIPSVGISHGQLFAIANKPDYVSQDLRLSYAWDKQATLNQRASMFTSWQIGTNFVNLETNKPTAAVARPPLRPEFVKMTKYRKAYQIMEHNEIVKNLFLFGQENPPNTVPIVPLRKSIVCYFRDKDGQMAVDALHSMGFDIFWFATGFEDTSADVETSSSLFGKKWVVRGEDRLKMRKEAGLDVEDTGKHRRLSEAIQQPIPVQPSSTKSGPRVVRVHDRNLFVSFMAMADGIASSAGSQLLSECIYANIPLLAIYKDKDDEQALNVIMSRHDREHKPNMNIYGVTVSDLQSNFTSPDSRSEFNSFVAKVHASKVSEGYYVHLTKNDTMLQAIPSIELDNEAEGEDPFQGMQHAAPIILEIVKKVEESGGHYVAVGFLSGVVNLMLNVIAGRFH